MRKPTSGGDDDSTALDRERSLDTRQVGELVGFATITMHQIRERGEGPPFFRVGRSVRYRLGDVLDWRDSLTVGKRAVRMPAKAAGSKQ